VARHALWAPAPGWNDGVPGVSALDADRDEIAHFVDALFRHANNGTFVSLRAFSNDRPWRTDLWRTVQLSPDRTQLIDDAARCATQAANAATPVVFCPPVATFNGSKATEANLSDGLVLSVECDARPNEARVKLEELLGPATVIVASGGEWIDAATGEVEPKLHLHWRLAVPARTPEEHKDLKLARRLAAMIVAADATAVPSNHPLRWPGSWHRKGQPRLARIVGSNPKRETMLSEALMILRDEFGDIDETPHRSGEPQAPIEQLEAAMVMLPNDDRHWDEWNKFGMALYAATGGSDEGLELFKRWSAKSAKFNAAATKKRWQHYHNYPPTRSGAGTIFYAAAIEWVDPDWDDYGDPSEFTTDFEQPVRDAQTQQSAPLLKPNGAGAPMSKPNGRDTDGTPAKPGWPVLGPAAYHGLAGRIVRAIEPNSEADPSALLIQFLAAYGNVIGRGRYCLIGATQHHGRLFVALVGETATGRKGTALAMILMLFRHLGREQLNTSSGLSTGEGLIQAVRDPKTKIEDDIEVVVDEGVIDKRLLVIEEELSRLLRVMARPENILSTIVRQAWDGGDLAVMTKASPARATAPHISIISHTTRADIVKYFSGTEAANGFGNRFLFWLTRRSKLLPRGGHIEEAVIGSLVGELGSAVSFADLRYDLNQTEARVNMDESAWALWDEAYPRLAAERPGMLGAMTARAAPYVRRLALLYALLDHSDTVKRAHLEAALECWRYAEDSVKYLFGTTTGDALADEVLRVLKEAGSQGMRRAQLRDEFGRHRSSADLGRALNLLVASSLVSRDIVPTAGRSAETYRALPTQG
jgi:hypothetical protein